MPETANHSLLTNLFRRSPDPQCVISGDGRIVVVNDAFAKELEYDAEELTHLPLVDLLDEQDDLARAELARASEESEHLGFACRMRTKTGTVRAFMVHGLASPSDDCVLFTVRTASVSMEVPRGERGNFFRLLAHLISTTLRFEHVFIFLWLDRPVTKMEALGAVISGEVCEDYLELPIANTPCEIVSQGRACSIGDSVISRYPIDQFLIDNDCESYLGSPMFDSKGEIIGHICVLDKRTLSVEECQHLLTSLAGFARQAAVEFQRAQAEESYRLATLATASISGRELLEELARYTGEALRVGHVRIDELQDPDRANNARRVASWSRDESEAPSGGDFAHSLTLVDAGGLPIGKLSMQDRHPIELSDSQSMVATLFAIRASSELLKMRSERVTQAHQEQLRVVVEALGEALIIYDAAGVILQVNHATERSLGYSPGDLIGKPLEEVQPQATQEWLAMQSRLLQEGTRTIETNYHGKNGEVIPVEVKVDSFAFEGQSRVVSVARDITDRKEQVQHYRESIRALSSPIMEVWEKVVVLPVIGTVNRDRAAEMMEKLLNAISSKRAEYAILDLTGVTDVDTATVSYLVGIVKSATLLGSRCLLSGITADTALSMVMLEADIRDLMTFSTLQLALRHAMAGKKR